MYMYMLSLLTSSCNPVKIISKIIFDDIYLHSKFFCIVCNAKGDQWQNLRGNFQGDCICGQYKRLLCDS